MLPVGQERVEVRLKVGRTRAPGWLSVLSIWLLILAQVMISWLVGSNPASGSVQIAQSLCGALSLSLSLLSLKINKLILKKNFF